MTTTVRTPECFPQVFGALMALLDPRRVAHHEACPGGFTLSGVLGNGWVCPCECHREAKS